MSWILLDGAEIMCFRWETENKVPVFQMIHHRHMFLCSLHSSCAQREYPVGCTEAALITVHCFQCDLLPDCTISFGIVIHDIPDHPE